MSDRDDIFRRAAAVRLAVFDVDGVLTGGEIIFSGSGETQKIFNVQDGLGLVMLMRSGCEVAIISSRNSPGVTARMADIGVTHVYQDQQDKRAAIIALMNKLNVSRIELAYTGDDLVDIPAMRHAGFAVAVANAPEFVKQQADYTTLKPGGAGAVREVCELILRAQGKLESIFDSYLL